MLSWLDPQTLSRTYRDPIAWAILLVDLFPIYAIFAYGWDATSLVFLYWLENLVIGAMTLLRMAVTTVNWGPFGPTVMLVMGPFFTFHYGMFCFVHGVFLVVMAQLGAGSEPPFPTPTGVIDYALPSGRHMIVFVGAIIGLQMLLFLRDFLGRGEFRESDPMTEMAKPYGRIVVLHIGIFVGFGLMLALGQPMLGVLGLIALRAMWGVYQTVLRRIAIDEEQDDAAFKVDEASRI
ncbi:DUF6498-containing protein [Henriciella sp. AS95]|uniref:DUF6498-containing protein n=1 Tax=Henriciella sp. AS95 TaxID=3135782 RepID=UPI0031749766